MHTHHDNAGNPYVDVQNLRLTWIRKSGEADWAETGQYLRISAYKDAESNRLHMGAEMPVSSHADVTRLIKAIAGSSLEALEASR